MPPAARVGDMTAHGTPLSPGPGSETVLIGGMPAWRATSDFHACPMFTGNVPHVGGFVAIGSTTVLINGLPAARQGDLVTESGPPNFIAMGCPTVIIGDLEEDLSFNRKAQYGIRENSWQRLSSGN
jgi:uncharacterized Zn-binding protein involved in type VI secretion